MSATDLNTKVVGNSSEAALLSVYDKTNLLDFARGLHDANVRLLGSGGTAKKIRDAGIPIECASRMNYSFANIRLIF